MKKSKIVSMIYKNEINDLCFKLQEYNLSNYFVCYMVFNNGNQFIVSNMSDILERCYHENLYQEDDSTNVELFNNEHYYFCEVTQSVSENLKTILENNFNIYRKYFIIRRCPECIFIIGLAGTFKEPMIEKYYKQTFSNLEDFSIYFMDNFIEKIKLYNSDYKNSIILNDKYYRANIIKNKKNIINLTRRELSCLFWAAQGKTTEETASILKIGKATVETYRTEVKRKLDCSNITHAVYTAITSGLLGDYNNFNQKIATKKYTNLIY